MRNRWYEPKTGRFLSEDPIGLAGGINLYTFAGGDPVNRRDPTGLSECGDHEIGHWDTKVGSVGIVSIEGEPVSSTTHYDEVYHPCDLDDRGVPGGGQAESGDASPGGVRGPWGTYSKIKGLGEKYYDCASAAVQAADVVPWDLIPLPQSRVANVMVEFGAWSFLLTDILRSERPASDRWFALGIWVGQTATLGTGNTGKPWNSFVTSMFEMLILNPLASQALNGTPDYVGVAKEACGKL